MPVQELRVSICRRRASGSKTGFLDYVDGKQTISQLAAKYGVSERTIVRDLENMHYVRKISKAKHVVIQMDTTYREQGFGLMVIKDAFRNKVIWRKYVRYETVAGYM